MYTYRIRGKRGPFKIILPDSFCSFLTPPGMSGSPPSFSDYLYFYSFMNRKIHAHFHWQPISIVRYCSFSFFREDYAETVIVLFLIFRIGLFDNICPYCLPVCPPARRHFSDPLWGHFLFSGITNQVCRPFSRILRDRKRHILLEVRTGNNRRSLCKPPRTEYASLSLSHIFRIHLRTAWLSFSLGKGSAREIPFFLWKNNKEEQAARTFWRSLNHAEPWLSIGCEIFCRQIVYFFCRFKSFSCWLSSNCVVYIKSTCFLYIVDC